MTTRWVIAACIGLPAYYLLIAHLAVRSYQPMSDRISRALRTFVQAFIAAALPLIGAKLGDVKAATDLAGLPSLLAPIVVGAIGAGVSAAMHVLFPPKAPPAA